MVSFMVSFNDLSDEKKQQAKKLIGLLVIGIIIFMILIFVVISRHS